MDLPFGGQEVENGGEASVIFNDIPDSYADNPHILRWWRPIHDELIRERAASMDWFWPWEIATAIEEVTAPQALAQWRDDDPVCHKYAWYNVLMYFALARAQRDGLDSHIAQPQTLTCLRCGGEFNQRELPLWALHRLGGTGALRFCLSCTKQGFFGEGPRPRCSKKGIRNYLSELHRLSGQIPGSRFFDTAGPLVGLDAEVQGELLALGAARPGPECIKKLYSSHLEALVDAGVLPEGTRRTARGTHCLANDGHLCLSLGEKVIDDWLTAHGYKHEKEPAWPEGNMRADFQVGDTYIEYFGLAGDPAYDAKIIRKRELARAYDIPLVEVYPRHIRRWSTGQELLSKALMGNPGDVEQVPQRGPEGG